MFLLRLVMGNDEVMLLAWQKLVSNTENFLLKENFAEFLFYNL